MTCRYSPQVIRVAHRGCRGRRLVLLLGWVVLFPFPASAKGPDAVVILMPESPGISDPCREAETVNYVRVAGLKLNGKEALRVQAGDATMIDASGYKEAKKIKLTDLWKLQQSGSRFLAFSSPGSPGLTMFPDGLDSRRSAVWGPDQLRGILIEGTDPAKKKVLLELGSVWKVFISPQTPEAALFAHVSEENRTSLWRSYLALKTGLYVEEALAGLHTSLLTCARHRMSEFRQGSWAAGEQAAAYLDEAEQIRRSGEVSNLKRELDEFMGEVTGKISQMQGAAAAGDWDEAADLAAGLKDFLADPELGRIAEEARAKSYEAHMQAGSEALARAEWQSAVEHFEHALRRVPESVEASAGHSDARAGLSIEKAGELRRQTLFREARQVLIEALAVPALANRPDLIGVLRETNCELGGQLTANAVSLLTGGTSQPARRGTGRAASPQSVHPPQAVEERLAFHKAVAALREAKELCDPPDTSVWLEAASAALGRAYVREGRRAFELGYRALAWLYASAALRSAPWVVEVRQFQSSLLPEQPDVERLAVGVVSGGLSPQFRWVADRIATAVADGAEKAPLKYQLLTQPEAEALIRHAGRQDRTAALFRIVAVQADVQPTTRPRRVDSIRLEPNNEYARLSQLEGQARAAYDSCRKSKTGQDCSSYKARLDAIRAELKRVPEYLEFPYTFTEREHAVSGRMQAVIRLEDRGMIRGADLGSLEASTDWRCLERRGVHQRDKRNLVRGGLVGALLSSLGGADSGPLQDQECVVPSTDSVYVELARQLQEKISAAVAETLGDIHKSLTSQLGRLSREVALDHAASTILWSRDLTSEQAQTALNFIRSIDQGLVPHEASP